MLWDRVHHCYHHSSLKRLWSILHWLFPLSILVDPSHSSEFLRLLCLRCRMISNASSLLPGRFFVLFILKMLHRPKHKIICPDDKLFDADQFFENEDPALIDLHSEQDGIDTPLQDMSRPRATSASRLRTPRERLAPRAESTSPPRSSSAQLRGIYFSTPGDKATLQPTYSRRQAAVHHWQSALPGPITISTLD